jgi:hypothetical protein
MTYTIKRILVGALIITLISIGMMVGQYIVNLPTFEPIFGGRS